MIATRPASVTARYYELMRAGRECYAAALDARADGQHAHATEWAAAGWQQQKDAMAIAQEWRTA